MGMERAGYNGSCRADVVVSYETPLMSAFMFSAGVLGNTAALVLLEFRRRSRKKKRSSSSSSSSSLNLFQVLLTTLLVTDLVGTCSVSPLVIAAYARNESLLALGGGGRAACSHFGFSMTFFSVVTLAVLLGMALERCLSIALPYSYQRHLRARTGYVALALVYVLGVLFCLVPLVGFSGYVQYCPGTWCFIDMHSTELAQRVYKNVYGSLLLGMIGCIVLCNATVIYHLVLMYRRQSGHRDSVRRLQRTRYQRSLSEELEHLVLLTFMTITFLICSLPLVIRVYISSFSETKDYALDLTALLLLSMNPIIDPWVFILLSPPVPRLLWGALCKALRPQSGEEKVPPSPCSPTPTTIELQS